MNPIPPVPDFQLAIARGGGAAGPADVIDPGVPALPVVAPPHEVASFEQMMTSGVTAPPKPQGSEAGSLATHLVLSEDEALQTVSNDALYMLHNAGDMSFNQIAAASVQMQIETASLQVDMSMKISVVESSKGALETLMKNQ
ncbi:hypothetical protein [Burkholderia sp. BCC0397]|uniref:hypothetical protein n=1 Tax=Burkholderia sp. BCC0397 TaxID=486876 RepID=UPI00158E19C4|nr:hypothetical protein [Burkholderia sp. BCC0397]